MGGQAMRRICEVCNIKNSCPYIKKGRTRDCIDVQTTDYGYEEAVDNTCEYFLPLLKRIGCSPDGAQEILRKYKQTMEDKQ